MAHRGPSEALRIPVWLSPALGCGGYVRPPFHLWTWAQASEEHFAVCFLFCAHWLLCMFMNSAPRLWPSWPVSTVST